MLLFNDSSLFSLNPPPFALKWKFRPCFSHPESTLVRVIRLNFEFQGVHISCRSQGFRSFVAMFVSFLFAYFFPGLNFGGYTSFCVQRKLISDVDRRPGTIFWTICRCSTTNKSKQLIESSLTIRQGLEFQGFIVHVDY